VLRGFDRANLRSVRATFLSLSLVTTTLFLVCLAPPAAANGRFPQSNQIVFSPTDQNIIVARTTYAVLPSNDNGKTWGYLCEDVLGLPATASYEDPELGITANNALVAGLFAPQAGLNVSKDMGCNWSCVGGELAAQHIVDTVVRPDAPHQVLALTKTYNDAGTYSQVFQTVDDGATWSTLGTPIDPTFFVETIDVAAGDPMRIYVSGERSYSTARTASLMVSTDGAATWTEHPLTDFDATNEDSLYIGGVDPTNEDVVYLRSRALASGGNSRLYVTKDGGKTFQPPIKSFVFPTPPQSSYIILGELLGFAISPDGSKVYTGSKESGLWMAARDTLTFTQVNSKVQVLCLATRQTSTGPELWACSTELGGFIVGKSTDDGAHFDVKMATITSMNGLIACSPSNSSVNACGVDANASACTCAEYTGFCSITEPDNACLGCGQTGSSDGGGSGEDATTGGSSGGDAAPSSDAGTHESKSSGCGCTTIGRPATTAGSLAGVAIAAIALRRRRRR
jgi:photosystem II stability/assembly factor-like uncharacterized protein